MARRIVEKRKEAAKVKDEQPIVGDGEKKLSEEVDVLGDLKVLGDGGQPLNESVGSSKKRKRSKDAENNEIHKISDDEQKSENVVIVYKEFAGSTADVRSLWDSQFEFGNLIDVECSLPGDQSQLDRWGPRSAHVMLQIQGICSAFLGRYLELQHINEVLEVGNLHKQVTALEKDLTGYEELRTKVAGLEGRVALLNQEKEDLAQKNKTLSNELSQAKTDKAVDAALFQEKADHEVTNTKSATDRDQFTAEVAEFRGGRVLVDLIVGESEENAASVQDNILVDKETKKVDSEGGVVQIGLVDEVLGNALCN
ncbi:putative girdin-like [Sesbania bispinosa]|nr:putative girdin-like [Sesbania bispinosa]